jgi:hypothetical protein
MQNIQLQELLDTLNKEVGFGVSFQGRKNVNTFCPYHEDPKTSVSQSCSVGANGLFSCRGCAASGTVIDFYMTLHSCDRRAALAALKTDTPQSSTRLKRILKEENATYCREELKDHPEIVSYISRTRGISPVTAEKYQVGYFDKRITFPIRDQEGTLVNLRRYKPGAKTMKVVSFGEGYGSPRLYPLQVLNQDVKQLVVCEGEWDVLLLNQAGIPAITCTGGAGHWTEEYNALLKDYTLIFLFDVNDKNATGELFAQQHASSFELSGGTSLIATLPLPSSYVGGDVTDYLMGEGHSTEELKQVIAEAVPVGTTPEGEELTLHDAAASAFFHKAICVEAVVAGKGASPFLPPKKVRYEWKTEDDGYQKDVLEISSTATVLLNMLACSSPSLNSVLASLCPGGKKALIKYEVIETHNVEEVYLIPALDHKKDTGPYVLRKAYYVGFGLQTNTAYAFKGLTVADPRSQAATHLFSKATPVEADIDHFTLTPEEVQNLTDTFVPPEGELVEQRMENIAQVMQDHVTNIYGRPTLHTAVDLVYHSPLSFTFDTTFLRRGWLDCLVIGDTRTGKGFVTEGLRRHYRVGEMVSGENISLAGLLGGVQKLGDRWMLVWGKVPLADRRLLVIDEASALNPTDIGKLSRVRSEGIVEITKIITEKTSSRTRLIWLANPRAKDGQQKMIAEFNYGIESVPQLIGCAEDIARFDYVHVVAHGEVSSKDINRRKEVSTEMKYPTDLCHKLIMWIWSRTPEDIEFRPSAVKFIYRAAQNLAKVFSPKIPLIQGEDVRFKLARIAAAVAGRLFSSPDGKKLVIRERHAHYAYNFLHALYNKPSSGYAAFSAVEKDKSSLRDEKTVRKIVKEAGEEFLQDFIEGLIEQNQITLGVLQDYSGMEMYQARALLGALVRERALTKEHSYYTKRPAFKNLLLRMKAEAIKDQPITMPEEV